MKEIILIILLIYLVLINLTAVILTISDKRRAQNDRWRISENTLILIGLFGGAICEYIAMKSIRHKTKHAKFMIGLPLIIFIHLVLIILTIYKVALI